MFKDSFTEVTHESWFGRIRSAIMGIVIGPILILIAFLLLFWNEGRAIKRSKTLKEGSGAVVSVVAENVDPANSGKLIHVTGKADTDARLTDYDFNVSVNALKLKRVVEMYQWEETSQSETKEKIGGETETVTTYTYNKIWSERPISSASFGKPAGHQNPGSIPYKSMQQIAGKVTFGAFTLSSSLVGKIDNFRRLPIRRNTPLPAPLKYKAKVHDAGFYIGAYPQSPRVGDIRVQFKVVKPAEVSVIAKQVRNTFEPYHTKAGGTIELLQTGVHTADAMLQKEQESNTQLTWILRLVGFLLMLVGLNSVFKPLSVIASFLPILGTIVSAGTGLISFLLSGILSLVTIAIAWIAYRPLLAIILIVVAAGLTVGIKRKLKKGEKKQTKKTNRARKQKPTHEEISINKTKIRFECLNCGSKYAANPNQAGQKGDCRKCGHMIVVPKLKLVER